MSYWYEEETDKYYFDADEAYRYESFFPKFLTHVKGELGGQPFELMDWVRHDIIRPLFGVKRKSDGTRRFRVVYCEVPRKNAKFCSVLEKIPTPNGWKLMRDIKEGDEVFAINGEVANVQYVSDILFNQECYRVHFENADPIIVSGDHRWLVWDKNTNQGRRVVDTETLFKNQKAGARGDWRYRVDLPGPLDLPDIPLEVDPYLLGLWLGDGTVGSSRITIGQTDLQHYCEAFKALGYDVDVKHHRSNPRVHVIHPKMGHNNDTFGFALNTTGVLKNKHIPESYFWGSIKQRLSLLQGLMDSDGTCLKTGQCVFTSVTKPLADGVYQLLCSLGYKPSIIKKPSFLNGERKQDHYRVAFFGWSDIPVFRLRRKLERLRDRPQTKIKRKNTGRYETSVRSLVRTIRGVEKIESVPVKCFAIDHPSHCFLVGKDFIPTHNTTVAAGIALAVAFLDHESGSEIYSAAADREQAAICFEIAKHMVENNKILSKMSQTYRRAITIPRTMTSYKVISADASTKHGFNAHCVIFDELHAQPNRDLWDVLLTSVGARRQPIVFAITTAGYDKNSICYEQHNYAKRVMSGEVEDDSFLPVIYGIDDDDDWTSRKAWQKANPALGISIKTEYIERECKKAQEVPTYENTFRRLHLNQWTEQDVRWIQMSVWDECGQELIDPEDLEGMECFAGLDLSATQDLTALVLAFPFENGDVKLLPFFWIPEENLWKRARKDKVPYETWRNQGLLEECPGEVIDYQRIRKKINELHERFNIREIACDRWNAQSLMTELDEQDGFTVVPLSQQMSSMSGPSKELEKLLIGRALHHGNNPILRWCAGNVTVKQDANGNIRPDKEKSTERIDGIVATICALSRAMVHCGPSSVYGGRGLLTL